MICEDEKIGDYELILGEVFIDAPRIEDVTPNVLRSRRDRVRARRKTDVEAGSGFSISRAVPGSRQVHNRGMLFRWRSLLLAVFLLPAAAGAAEKRYFQVAHGGDSGPGSLRQAIDDANASPTQNWILIPCELTVTPLSPLPEITRIVAIQSSCASATQRATIDGSAAGAGDGLVARVPLRLFYVDVTRFAGAGVALRDHFESVILGSRITACGRGIEIRGGGRHALAFVEASDNAAEGILAVASNANALGHPGHCGIPEGCSDLDEDLRFDGWLDGEVTVRGNERGLVASGELNIISVIARDNRGDGVVLEGSSEDLFGRASGNWGVGVRARGFHPPGIVSSGNGGGDRALDDEFVAVDAVAKAWTDDTERQPSSPITLVSGTLLGAPNRTYRLDVIPEDPFSDWTIERRPGALVVTDSSGREEFSFVQHYHFGAGQLVVSRQWTDPTGVRLPLYDQVESTVMLPAIEPARVTGGDLSVGLEGPAAARKGEPFQIEVTIAADANALANFAYFSLSGATIISFLAPQVYGVGANELGFFIAPGQTLRWSLLVAAQKEGAISLEATVRESPTRSPGQDANPSNDRAFLQMTVGAPPSGQALIVAERVLIEPLPNGLVREVWEIRNEGGATGEVRVGTWWRYGYGQLLTYGFSDRCGEELCSTRALPAGATMLYVAYRWPGGSSRRRVVTRP